MVNPTILEYIKRYRNQYPLESLKQKIISSGYSRKEVEETISSLGLDDSPDIQNKNWKKGFKWMKLAGIIGMIFVILGVISVTYSLISFKNFSMTFPSQSSSFPIWGYIVIAITILMFILYFYGFVRMGKYTQSKLLKFSAWAIIITIIVLVLASIGLAIYGINNSKTNNLTGNAISSYEEGNENFQFPLAYKITIYICLVIIIWLAVLSILLSIGLIMVGTQVKFAKLSGLFGIIATGLATYNSVSLMIKLLSPEFYVTLVFALLSAAFSSFSSSGASGNPLWNIFGVFIILIVISEALFVVTVFFQSLSLFNASKKFE